MLLTYKTQSVKAENLLVALYNNTRPLGMGIFLSQNHFTVEMAVDLIAKNAFDFDYVYGRPIKVVAIDGILDDHYAGLLYDRDAGKGGFDRAFEIALQMP